MTLSITANTNLFQGNVHIQQSDKLTSFSMQGPLHQCLELPFNTKDRVCVNKMFHWSLNINRTVLIFWVHATTITFDVRGYGTTYSSILKLGKASKYRVTPMPINRVPIFSDSVSIGTDKIGTDWNGIGNGSNFFIGPITDISILDLYLSAFIKGL